ncbi:hypothetical protein [Haliscomenobacter sp.]|uniref:hypothetical protein n=1 Tax=Haliscomenobacter sp. TaxID=2717303 RepID=UPI0033651A78
MRFSLFPILLLICLSCKPGQERKFSGDFRITDYNQKKDSLFLQSDSLILDDGLTNLKIGDPIEKFWEVFKGRKIEYYEGFGYMAFLDSLTAEALMSTKDKKHITMLGFYLPKHHTNEGIYVGCSVDSLLAKNPNFYLQRSNLDDEEFCRDFSNPLLKKNLLRYLIEPKSGDGLVGKYSSDQETREINQSGRVSGIEIWTTN